MLDIHCEHEHHLDEYVLSESFTDWQSSMDIIKSYIIGFAKRIKKYTRQMLAGLRPNDLYRLHQALDDVVHMETGEHLAGLILKEPDIQRELPVIRSYYATFFNIHEVHLANELLKSVTPWESLKCFPLYPRYEALVRNEIDAMHIMPDSILAFVGCGPLPVSLILMNHLYSIRCVGVDSSSETVRLSKQVIQYLGLGKEIEIIHGNHSCLQGLDWDAVLVAALAEPKAQIFQSLREILKKRDSYVPVVFRTYTGMRAILHKPVQSSDIEGFRIVKEILPTGRVNNTTVFAELDT